MSQNGDRRKRVFKTYTLLKDGLSSTEIAHIIGVSPKVIEEYIIEIKSNISFFQEKELKRNKFKKYAIFGYVGIIVLIIVLYFIGNIVGTTAGLVGAFVLFIVVYLYTVIVDKKYNI